MNTESPSPARSRKTAARSVPYSNRCRQTSPRHGSKISKSSCRSAALPHPGASANRASHGRSSHGIYPEKLPKASPILDATCLASVYVYVYIYIYIYICKISYRQSSEKLHRYRSIHQPRAQAQGAQGPHRLPQIHSVLRLHLPD